MTQQIGSPITGLTAFNINTLIPSLSDSADVQEAFRIYHFGAPSGTGSGFYDTTNTDGTQLYPNSVAGALYSLQSQILTLSGSLGIQASTFTAKGDLLTATGASIVSRLGVGTNGQVLTANSATGTGLEWSNPEVTLVNTATLQNKTLQSPKISSGSSINDSNGAALINFPTAITAAVSSIQISNAISTNAPTISVVGGTVTNISLNLASKGTGVVTANGVEIVTLSGTQTLTNKTLTAPTVTQLYVSDSVVVFEGATADAFETTLGALDATADRTINLPNVDGTIITTGNLSSITAVGTVTSGSFPAANISGTTLASNVTGSSLTSLGTVTSGSFPAANLSGTILASNVVSSSLTSVGTLDSLSVTNDVNVGGNLISHIKFNTTPTGAYTLVTADDGKVVEMPSGGILTVPADGGTFVVPTGSQITILQTSGSQVTIQGTGATVNATPGFKLRAQWSSCTLIKRGSNLWVAMGDLTA